MRSEKKDAPSITPAAKLRKRASWRSAMLRLNRKMGMVPRPVAAPAARLPAKPAAVTDMLIEALAAPEWFTSLVSGAP
jgi:hypothetical protein